MRVLVADARIPSLLVEQVKILPGWRTTSSEGLLAEVFSPEITAMVCPCPLFLTHDALHADFSRLIAYGEPNWMERAFALGVADYIVLPTTELELMARTNRVIAARYLAEPTGNTMQIGGLEVRLSGTQMAIWRTLYQFRGVCVDRTTLMERAGIFSRTTTGSRALDMTVSRLRAAIRETTFQIESVRNRGYRLVEKAATSHGGMVM